MYQRDVEGGGEMLRDRREASECDNGLLRLFGADNAGNDSGAKRFDVAAAAIFPALPPPLICWKVSNSFT